jgi:hypothetical protein
MMFRVLICLVVVAFTVASFEQNFRKAYAVSVLATDDDGTCPSDYPKYCGNNQCCPSDYDCPESGSNDCTKKTSCFSGTDEVTRADGTNVRISELSAGDKVLSWNNGLFTHSEVVFLPHAKNDDESDFVQVTLKSGRSLKATPSHILPAGSCQSSEKEVLPLVPAAEVTPGQCMRSLAGLDEVVQVEKVADKGLYTLVTHDEFVVVNGIVASPFASNHFAVNKFYNLHRALYTLWPAVLSMPALQVREMTLVLGGIMVGITGYDSK